MEYRAYGYIRIIDNILKHKQVYFKFFPNFVAIAQKRDIICNRL